MNAAGCREAEQVLAFLPFREIEENIALLENGETH